MFANVYWRTVATSHVYELCVLAQSQWRLAGGLNIINVLFLVPPSSRDTNFKNCPFELITFLPRLLSINAACAPRPPHVAGAGCRLQATLALALACT